MLQQFSVSSITDIITPPPIIGSVLTLTNLVLIEAKPYCTNLTTPFLKHLKDGK